MGYCDNNPVGFWRGLDKRFHQNWASWPMGIVAILSKPVVMAFRDVDPLPTARLCRKTRLGSAIRDKGGGSRAGQQQHHNKQNKREVNLPSCLLDLGDC